MTRTKLDALLQLVKALRKVEHLIECHTTLERVAAQSAKEKCTKVSGFNSSVVNSESLVMLQLVLANRAQRSPDQAGSPNEGLLV